VSLLDLALQLALQRMLDSSVDPMMVAAGTALRADGGVASAEMLRRPASELAGAYRERLGPVDRLAIDVLGIPEAILSFEKRDTDPIESVTIYGVERDYLVFFIDADRLLVACISLPSTTGVPSRDVN
jgi:hypothetical protein